MEINNNFYHNSSQEYSFLFEEAIPDIDYESCIIPQVHSVNASKTYCTNIKTFPSGK